MAFAITLAQGLAIGAPLLGGLLGSGGSQSSSSNQQTMDPRMAEAVYGANGVIPSAQDWYSKNKTGLNAMMLQGMDNQYNQLGASRQGYNQMQNLGMGLMGGGAAGNPFAGGYKGGTDFSGGMNGNGGGIAPQAMSYTPAVSTQSVSPFAAQYSLDAVQRAKDEEIAKAKAATVLAQAVTPEPFRPWSGAESA